MKKSFFLWVCFWFPALFGWSQQTGVSISPALAADPPFSAPEAFYKEQNDPAWLFYHVLNQVEKQIFMMSHQALIKEFYTAFQAGDAEAMVACYHDDIVFEDPAFGRLEGDEAKAMWRMLLSRDAALQIEFSNVRANDERGSANWRATYFFGPKKRKVVNEISASFEFKDGKIYRHTDRFDLWKWSRQALGAPGVLLGWSGFFRGKLRGTTRKALDEYMSQPPAGS